LPACFRGLLRARGLAFSASGLSSDGALAVVSQDSGLQTTGLEKG